MSVANHNNEIEKEIANLRSWLVRTEAVKKNQWYVTVSQRDMCDTMIKILTRKIERLEAMKINEG